MPTSLNHTLWNRNLLGLPLWTFMQEIPICWLWTALYNPEWPPIMARCSVILLF